MKKADFKNCSKEYGGAPFWSWNDKLEDEELVRQIAEMDEKGWSGFFMHAREGLVTTYLSKKWMDRIETCVREAAKRGMKAWLYDEDKWPSGFAGGIVPAQSKEYRMKGLMFRMGGRLDEVEEAIRIFKCDMEDGTPKNVKLVKRKEKEEADKTYLYFNLRIAAIGEEWFGGYSYTDNLNPEAIEAFIKSTHEPYYERVGKWFGKAVPGIFTDEPSHAVAFFLRPTLSQEPIYVVPWTKDLPEYFKEKGYDIRDHLPSLFFQVGDHMKIRHDYWETVTDLFLRAYTKQLYEWCDKHGLKYTGHYHEDTLLSQVSIVGAAMPHYEYMHIPGIDHLGKNIDHPLKVKQVSSVAEQLGKERVLSETYGCSGQSLSFEDRKWIGDWEYVLGVNLLNQHLSLYTMRGRRKRDYPPNLFYQQPWWKYNRLIADYFTRLSYALTRGKRITDILVIHPIASAWALYTPLNTEEAGKFDQSLEWITKTLLELHRDYEFGDEKIIKGHGSVEGRTFIVGRSQYEAVIVPPAIILSETTFKLLQEYVDNGGRLVVLKPIPYLIDGRESKELKELLNKAIVIEDKNEEELSKALKAVPFRVEISDAKGKSVREVWYQLRRDGDQQILFLANTDREKSFKTEINIMGRGRVEEWNPFNGETFPVSSEFKDGHTTVNLDFPPIGSHLIVLNEGEKPATLKTAKFRKIKEIALGDKWAHQRFDLNALTLDHCRVKLGEGRYGETLPTWKAHRTILGAGFGTDFEVQYEFNSGLGSAKGREIYLVLETPEEYAIKVNGKEVKYEDTGYWVDTTFKKIDISKLVKRGKNLVEIAGRSDFSTEIESCYIVGDFGVENQKNTSFKLVDESEKLESGDLVNQGYPFFAGTISISQEFKSPQTGDKAVLKIEGLNVTVARVLVNGKEAGHIFMRPHEIEITRFLKAGTNTLEIQLTNSLRNLLGPHHTTGEIGFVGPGTFMDEFHWTEAYQFVAYGLEKARIEIHAVNSL